MASVAIPMVAGFVVNKIGESQGWDPRMTAVLGMAAGYGVGGLVSGYAASAASGSAGAMGGAGTFSNGVSANAARVMTGAQIAQPGVTPTLANWGAAQAAEPAFSLQSNITGLPSKVLNSNYQAPFDAARSASTKASFMEVPASVSPSAGQWNSMYRAPQISVAEGFGKFHDANTTRPVDDQGRETSFSPLENLGVSMIKTLTTDLPEQRMSGGGGGGGGGGPLMAAYNGGGGASQKAQTWGFGGQQGGYNPQGIA